jgi:hypothetical protein
MLDTELLKEYKQIGTPEEITNLMDGAEEILGRISKFGTISEIEEKMFRLEGLDK